jgi:uncharacterized protein (DUF2249 family)
MPDLKDFAVKALNLTDEQFAEIVYSDDKVTFKDNAVEELLRLDAERVSKLKSANKEELTKMHDKGHQKGLAEGLSKFEGSLKEQFGVETSSQGVELVKEIIAKISKDTNLDDDKVKLHPLYLQLERKVGTDYIAKAEYDKVKGEFDGYKSQVEKDKVNGVVINDALKDFRNLKPVLSKDPTKALNQEARFLNELKSYEYEVQSDGNHVVKIDGKRLENAQGHPVLFRDFVKSQAEKYFDFEVQGSKGSAGNNNSQNNDIVVTVPTDKRAYLIALNNETDPQKRVAMMHAWNEANK